MSIPFDASDPEIECDLCSAPIDGIPLGIEWTDAWCLPCYREQTGLRSCVPQTALELEMAR